MVDAEPHAGATRRVGWRSEAAAARAGRVPDGDAGPGDSVPVDAARGDAILAAAAADGAAEDGANAGIIVLGRLECRGGVVVVVVLVIEPVGVDGESRYQRQSQHEKRAWFGRGHVDVVTGGHYDGGKVEYGTGWDEYGDGRDDARRSEARHGIVTELLLVAAATGREHDSE